MCGKTNLKNWLRITAFLVLLAELPIQAAETLTWDGFGDGYWCDTRWFGSSLKLYPDAETHAIISAADTVTVNCSASALSLSVSGGGIIIPSDRDLTVVLDVNLAPGTTMILGNHSELTTNGGYISSVGFAGDAILYNAGELFIDSFFDGGVENIFTKYGEGTLYLDNSVGNVVLGNSVLRVEDGRLAMKGADPFGGSRTVVLGGGELFLSNPCGELVVTDTDLVITDDSTLTIGGGSMEHITVAAWIKVIAFDKAWQAIVTKGDSAWRLHRYEDTNSIAFHCTDLSANVNGTINVNDGQWHHVAGVYDGKKLYLYIDGNLDNCVDASGIINKNDFHIFIGENAESMGRGWNGLIDEVSIFNYPLLPAYIHDLGLGGRDPLYYCPIAYWSLDETEGTIASDSSGNGNNGVLNGYPVWEPLGKVNGALYFTGSDYVDVNCGRDLTFIRSANTFKNLRLESDVRFSIFGRNVGFTDVVALNNVTITGDFGPAGPLLVNGNVTLGGNWIYEWEKDGGAIDLIEVTGNLFIEDGWTLKINTEDAPAVGKYLLLKYGVTADVGNVVYDVTNAVGWDATRLSIENDLSGNVFLNVTSKGLFVDESATGGANDGTSWTDAFIRLQDALATAGSGEKIWVAQGIYKPDEGVGTTEDDRTATFQLIEGVAIYGGFPSGGGSWDQRDPNAYETILSGDINTPGDNTDNSYHIVTGSGTDASAILDGFTIIGGNANGVGLDGYGGGIYNNSGYPTISNCKLSDNSALKGGGGMCNYNNSSGVVTNSIFIANSSDGLGGGILNWRDCSPTIINCIVSGNSADGGGGIENIDNSNSAIRNCVISGNTATNGAGMYNAYSNTIITNCTFSRNTATHWGGGMSNVGVGSSPLITNCIIWHNNASGFAEIYKSGSTPLISYSNIRGGWLGEGNIDDDPLFKDSDGLDNIFGTTDDDLRLSPGSPCIDTGDNNEPNLPLTDMEGHPRIIDGNCDNNAVVDMGTYEFNYSYIGDLDDNCTVDFFDFSIFSRAWMTKEGDPDWDWACDMSEPHDDYIDWRDVTILCGNWLAHIP